MNRRCRTLAMLTLAALAAGCGPGAPGGPPAETGPIPATRAPPPDAVAASAPAPDAAVTVRLHLPGMT